MTTGAGRKLGMKVAKVPEPETLWVPRTGQAGGIGGWTENETETKNFRVKFPL